MVTSGFKNFTLCRLEKRSFIISHLPPIKGFHLKFNLNRTLTQELVNARQTSIVGYDTTCTRGC